MRYWALGRVWILFESRENLKPENYRKKPQNPQRPVHALLEGFAQDSLIESQNRRHKTDEIITRTLIFSKNQKKDLPNAEKSKVFVYRDFS